MTPKINCNRFTISVTGKIEVTVELKYEVEEHNWEVSYDGGDAGRVFQSFQDLEEAVSHARKLAGNKIV